MRVPVLTLVIWLATLASSHAQSWPSFRGANASGIASGQVPPTTWDVTVPRNMLWKTRIPGLAHSSPIVWGDRVFLTTAESNDANPYFRRGFSRGGDFAPDFTVRHRWRVYCLDRRTGRVRWERTAHEGVPRSKRHVKSTYASATPATDGRHVVVFFGSEGLYCYDPEGRLLWKQDLGVLDTGSTYHGENLWGTASSPIIYENLVIVQCDLLQDSFLAAYDLETGRRMWRMSRDEIPSWATPTVYSGTWRTEIVTNAGKYVRGYDPSTGRELWRLGNTSEIAVPTPVAGLDLIFVTSGYQPGKPIYAIRPGATGDISMKNGEQATAHVAWSTQRGGSYVSTPLVYGDYLYTTSSNGVLACYDGRSGNLIYERRMADKGGAYSASPVAAGGKIYLASEDGEVHVVKAGPAYQLLATNPMGEALMATPAISEGVIFVRGDKHIYAMAERKQK